MQLAAAVASMSGSLAPASSVALVRDVWVQRGRRAAALRPSLHMHTCGKSTLLWFAHAEPVPPRRRRWRRVARRRCALMNMEPFGAAAVLENVSRVWWAWSPRHLLVAFFT